MASQFSRDIDGKILEKLMSEELWKNKLKQDCINGEVFLAIRSNYFSFYHKGGCLFKYDEKRGFQTHVKYASIINLKKEGYYVNENDLKKADLVREFLIGYELIKNNIPRFSKQEESGLSTLYHNHSYLSDLSNSNTVVLDIQIAFSKKGESTEEEETNAQDRIDILLFNKNEQKLRFIEAKLFKNDDIFAKLSLPANPKVIGQIKRYEEQIAGNHEIILSSYKKYVKTLNDLFNISLPHPKKIDNNVGLLIFDYKDSDKGKLEKQITNNEKYESNKIKRFSVEKLTKSKKVDNIVTLLWQKTTL